MHMPTEEHYNQLKRILRYIKGTIIYGLQFYKGSSQIIAFSDVDWAGDSQDRISTGGYCVYIGQNIVSWLGKKQPTVARSSTEAEYKALANAASKVLWTIQVMKDLKKFDTNYMTKIWCDNNSAIALATNPVFHARTKHVEVDFHFVRVKIANKQLQVNHVPTEFQKADIFTTISRFEFLGDKLQLQEPQVSLRGDVKDT